MNCNLWLGTFLYLHSSQMAHLLSTDLVTWHSDVVKNLYSQFCMHLLSWESSFNASVPLVIHVEQVVAMGSRNQWKQVLSVSGDCMGFAVHKKLRYFFQSWNPRTICAGQLERTAFVILLLPSTLEIFSQLLPRNEENICKKQHLRLLTSNFQMNLNLKSSYEHKIDFSTTHLFLMSLAMLSRTPKWSLSRNSELISLLFCCFFFIF